MKNCSLCVYPIGKLANSWWCIREQLVAGILALKWLDLLISPKTELLLLLLLKLRQLSPSVLLVFIEESYNLKCIATT